MPHGAASVSGLFVLSSYIFFIINFLTSKEDNPKEQRIKKDPLTIAPTVSSFIYRDRSNSRAFLRFYCLWSSLVRRSKSLVSSLVILSMVSSLVLQSKSLVSSLVC